MDAAARRVEGGAGSAQPRDRAPGDPGARHRDGVSVLAPEPAGTELNVRRSARRLRTVGERNEQRYPILGSDGARNMSLTGRVFRQEDVTGPEPNCPSAVELDFAFAAERHDVLTPRRR